MAVAGVTNERFLEIERAAALRCASQLNVTVTEDGPGSQTWDDYPDQEEREAFGTAVAAIVRILYRKAERL